MNRRILKAAIGALALTALALPAAAQETKPVGLGIRAGVLFPTSGGGSSRTVFGVGADYKLTDLNYGSAGTGTTSHLSLSADWYGRGEESAVPILINFVGMQNEIYYMAGAGLAFTRDEEVVGGVVTRRNRTNFAYSLAVGYNFQTSQTPFFIEGRFHGNSNPDLNAIGVYIGVRL